MKNLKYFLSTIIQMSNHSVMAKVFCGICKGACEDIEDLILHKNTFHSSPVEVTLPGKYSIVYLNRFSYLYIYIDDARVREGAMKKHE